MEKEYVYRKAIDVWGITAQVDMAIEECAELIKALQKRKRAEGTGTIDDVLEEMADVEIMLEQLKVIFDYTPGGYEKSQFEQLKKLKLKRLLVMLQ